MSEEKKFRNLPDRLSAEDIIRNAELEHKGDFLSNTPEFNEALELDLECLGEAIDDDDELIRDENARSGKEGPEDGVSN